MVDNTRDVKKSGVQTVLEQENAHILYTYHDHKLYIDQVLTYIEDGLRVGEVVLLVENERNYHIIINELNDRVSKEQMKLLYYVNSLHFYLSSGSYDPPAIKTYFTNVVEQFVVSGTLFRSWAHVEWATLEAPTHLVEQFERIVDEAVLQLQFSLICAYNSEKIPESLYHMLLQTHQYILDDEGISVSDNYFSSPVEVF